MSRLVRHAAALAALALIASAAPLGVAAQGPDGGATEHDAGRRRAWRPRRDAGPPAADARVARVADAGVARVTDAGARPRAMDAGVGSAVASDAGRGGDAGAPEGGVASAWDGSLSLDAGVAEAGLPADASVPDASGASEDGGALVDASSPPPVEPDAGVASAASPTPPPFFDPWEFFGRSDRRDDDEEDDEPASSAQAPVVTVLNGGDAALWDHVATLVPSMPTSRGGIFALILLIAITWFVGRWLARVRATLPDKGVLPRALSFLHISLRVLVAVFALGVVAQLLPDWARPVLPWVLVAGAIALGWSARDVLPDIVAGAVLFAERRLVRGEFVRIGGDEELRFEGVVIQLGLRVTTLRNLHGHVLRVPNRVVLATPLATRRGGWHEVRVAVRAPDGCDPKAFELALREAALLSPWAPIPTQVRVSRDPTDAHRFELLAQVVHARYEERFRGELLSRAESLLELRSAAKTSVHEIPHK